MIAQRTRWFCRVEAVKWQGFGEPILSVETKRADITHAADLCASLLHTPREMLKVTAYAEELQPSVHDSANDRMGDD